MSRQQQQQQQQQRKTVNFAQKNREAVLKTRRMCVRAFPLHARTPDRLHSPLPASRPALSDHVADGLAGWLACSRVPTPWHKQRLRFGLKAPRCARRCQCPAKMYTRWEKDPPDRERGAKYPAPRATHTRGQGSVCSPGMYRTNKVKRPP